MNTCKCPYCSRVLPFQSYRCPDCGYETPPADITDGFSGYRMTISEYLEYQEEQIKIRQEYRRRMAEEERKRKEKETNLAREKQEIEKTQMKHLGRIDRINKNYLPVLGISLCVIIILLFARPLTSSYYYNQINARLQRTNQTQIEKNQQEINAIRSNPKAYDRKINAGNIGIDITEFVNPEQTPSNLRIKELERRNANLAEIPAKYQTTQQMSLINNAFYASLAFFILTLIVYCAQVIYIYLTVPPNPYQP